jgi:hypothetical protein
LTRAAVNNSQDAQLQHFTLGDAYYGDGKQKMKLML